MASALVRQLINSGIHFGHRASRWNPKMAPYIFGKRNTIHILDIRETVRGLLRAKKFIAQVVSKGDDVLFVGTKRQARHQVKQQAGRVNMPYVIERWLGGTLTNFRTIRSRLARLEELEAAEVDGTAQEYSKKMMASRTREARRIKRNLEGIREMTRLPAALIVIDVQRERNAVREAKKLGIPTVCLIDTDSDPDYADVPIPGNDDAIRAIEVVLAHLVEAIELGIKARTAPPAEMPAGEQQRPSPPPAADRAGESQPKPIPVEASGGTVAAEPKTDERPVVGSPPENTDTGLTPATATEPDTPS